MLGLMYVILLPMSIELPFDKSFGTVPLFFLTLPKLVTDDAWVNSRRAETAASFITGECRRTTGLYLWH